MSKILIPNSQKIDKAEDIALPMVKCTFCHNDTTTGMHQVRLLMIKKGITKVVNGRTLYKPPVMQEIHYYMCPNCIAKGTKWPGQRP